MNNVEQPKPLENHPIPHGIPHEAITKTKQMQENNETILYPTNEYNIEYESSQENTEDRGPSPLSSVKQTIS